MGGVQQNKTADKCIILKMGKKKDMPKHKCYDCKYAYLMRSNVHDPIIAMCEKTKEREVASTILHCPYFDKNAHPIVVHPMIPCR